MIGVQAGQRRSTRARAVYSVARYRTNGTHTSQFNFFASVSVHNKYVIVNRHVQFNSTRVQSNALLKDLLDAKLPDALDMFDVLLS